MRKITQLEYSMIDSKVDQALARTAYHDKGSGFLTLILQLIFPQSEEEITSLITDGGNDRGADAVHIKETDDAAYVSMVQSKYARTLNSASKNFPGSEIDKLISLITDISNKTSGLLDSVNPALRSKIKDIWQLVERGKTVFFKIYLTSNTLPLVLLERDRLSAFCKQYDYVSFEEFSFGAIASLLASDKRPIENGTLDCIDLQKFERIDCDIRGLVVNIDANSFINMITNENQDAIKRHLFDENIRGYLGSDGGFNRQILQSAISDDNHLFWYLNNGITIIAKDFSHQHIRGSKIKLTDFQIVNGAQTSHSLFRARQVNPESLSQLVLLVKIFASSREDISERIAIATNSQARISPRDLKANDTIQKKIAAVFEDNGILYERKRNQFDASLLKPKVDSLKLGQAILAYYLEEPHKAKTHSDEIFGNMYGLIFSERLDANDLLKLARLYLFVSEHRENELGTLRRSDHLSSGSEFIGYAQWHLMYCIRLIANNNDVEIPDVEHFAPYLDQATSIIADIANQHQSQSYYRVFRSAKTKELIQKVLGVGQLQFEF